MLENLYPGQEGPSMQQVHNSVMNQAGGSVWVLDSLNEGRIFDGRLTYDKGAGIIHSMRYLINNDNLFFDALRAFQVAFKDSTSTGIAFKNFMENFTGVNLTPFFNEWYFGEGYPTYSVKWNQSGNDVAIEISHTSSMQLATPTFTNDIDLRFTRQGQADTTIRFTINSNTEQFSIYNIGTITGSIGIDPKNWIINKVGIITEDPNLNVGFESISEVKNIRVFPNPTNGEFTVQNIPSNTSSFELFDQSGKFILTQTVTKDERIRLTDLSDGNYIFSVILSDGQRKTSMIQIKK
jgi:hypothetical protein